MQAMSLPLQKALQIGLQQPRIAEIALVALESCPADVAKSLAPLIGPHINPYLSPVTLRRYEEQITTGECPIQILAKLLVRCACSLSHQQMHCHTSRHWLQSAWCPFQVTQDQRQGASLIAALHVP